METFKQIVYRESDKALLITPSNENMLTPLYFVDELDVNDQKPLIDLRDFCLTKVSDLKYVVHINGTNRLDIQPTEGDLVYYIIDDMNQSDKDIVLSAGNKCTELLNK